MISSWWHGPSTELGGVGMKKMMECLNERCNADVGSFGGHHKSCPICGSINISNFMFPENVKDIGTNREDYNRRHMHDPGFVPSVEYIIDPNDPTKTIPKPTES
jgi:hypothetical protein